MNKLAKIYIIGNIKDYKSIVTKLNINRLERRLIERGYEVVNPLKIYKRNKSISNSEAKLYNIKKLLTCNAAYVMSEVSLKKGDNLELKISLDIDLLILQDLNLDNELKEEIYQYSKKHSII